MLNNGTINQAINGSQFKDPFDLRITDEQVKQLFVLCIPKYDADLKKKLGLKLYKNLENTHEMVALFSLDYNAPGLIGPGIISAIKEGNRAKVQNQILRKSNKNRDLVLDNRRKREAKKIGRYDGDTPTAEELRAEKAEKDAHGAEMAAYDDDMDKKRKGKLAKRARGPKTASNNRRKRQQAGSLANQKEVRRRIDDVKAHRSDRGHTILERIIDMFGSHDKVAYRDWNYHPAAVDLRDYHTRWS